jgi:hypothetical protein
LKEVPDEAFSVRLKDLIPALDAVPSKDTPVKSSQRYLFYPYVELDFDGQVCQVKSGRGDLLTYNVPVECESTEGEECNQAFDPALLRVWANAFPDARLEVLDRKLEETGPTAPCRIVQDGTVLGVLMMRGK